MLRSLTTAVLLLAGGSVFAQPVTVYTSRQPHLIDPVLEIFTEHTGIKTDVVYVSRIGLERRLEQEGEASPADVVLLNNVSRLTSLVDMGLTQPVQDSEILKQNIPQQYRDQNNHWFALTLRTRNIFTHKDNAGPVNLSIEDLAKPEFKGKVCMRAGKSPFNQGLIASLIAHNGEALTREWLEGLKTNLVRKPQGTDKAQIIAVAEGVCDYAVANSYYYGYMLNDEKESKLAEQVTIHFPNQKNRGTHVNLSGAAVLKHSKNIEGAKTLIEFLSGTAAQATYPQLNAEYPVNPNASASDMVTSWGSYKADTIQIADWAGYHERALQLVKETRFRFLKALTIHK